MGQECFYRENRQEREEKEILLTKRQTADGSELLWRIRPMVSLQRYPQMLTDDIQLMLL